MPLIDELKETWTTENISPYGEVLIIPSKLFKNEWDQQLKSEGFKTFMQGYNGQTCVFVQLKKHVESLTESKPIQSKPKRRWTSQDDSLLNDLHSQGLTQKDIASKLSRSRIAVVHRLNRLGLLTNQQAINKPLVNESASLTDDVVKEFLSACSLLYPSHKTACAFLLKEASNRIMEETKT